MANTITTSIVVQFTGDSDADRGILSVEVDSRSDGLNNGKTSFRPGDAVYYLVFKSTNVNILKHLLTAGAKASVGIGNYEVVDFITFADSDEAQVSKPISSGFSSSWQGSSLGAIQILDGGSRIKAAQKGVGVLKVQYQSQYMAYKLSNVNASVEQVLIYLLGEVQDSA